MVQVCGCVQWTYQLGAGLRVFSEHTSVVQASMCVQWAYQRGAGLHVCSVNIPACQTQGDQGRAKDESNPIWKPVFMKTWLIAVR